MKYIIPAPVGESMTADPSVLLHVGWLIIEIAGVAGIAFTVTATLPAVPVHPFSLHVAVYVVFALGFTVIEGPVAPVDHVSVPEQPVPLSTEEPPAQILAGLADSVGADGMGLTNTSILADDTHPLSVHVAV
jgi:hypothetical protein